MDGTPREDTTRTYRHANVYNAVAGRVTLETTGEKTISNPRGTGVGPRPRSINPVAPPTTFVPYSSYDVRLAPEEALFRSKNAPPRYEEKDIYFAHEDLPSTGGEGILPDGDALETIHHYTSHFYEAMAQRARGAGRDAPFWVDGVLVDERSMDETALLAFGILLEEAGREVLGRRGDRVFTEGRSRTGSSSRESGSVGEQQQQLGEQNTEAVEIDAVDRNGRDGSRRAKRRKVK